MNKIRKGDEVVVIAGRDKGRRGTVVKVLEDKLVVENINMVKRHTKPNPQRNVQGGIVEKEARDRPVERDALESGRQEGRSHRLRRRSPMAARCASSSRTKKSVDA